MGTRDIRVQVRALTVEGAGASEQVAGILVAGFAEHWPGSWPDLGAARAAVRASFGADRISRVAVDEHGAVVGWIGGLAPDGRPGVAPGPPRGPPRSPRRGDAPDPVCAFAGR